MKITLYIFLAIGLFFLCYKQVRFQVANEDLMNIYKTLPVTVFLEDSGRFIGQSKSWKGVPEWMY